MPPTASDSVEHAAVLSYYRTVGPVMLRHLAGCQVVGFGAGRLQSAQPGVVLHIADAADLDEAVRSGVVSFLLPDSVGPGRLALRVRPGEGSGVDTAATTTLALMELMAADGVRTTAMVDGADGLYLAGVRTGGPQAADYARLLAGNSPEIATMDGAETDGRAWIEPLTDGGDGAPAPYTLVERPAGLAVIAPLTRDEVAAATAGMPLDIEPTDLAERIQTHGDLASDLARGPGR